MVQGSDNRQRDGSQRDALAALFEQEVGLVHGYLRARCGSPAAAEDVTSEVFAEAARRFKQGRGNEVSPAWLLTVAKRRLIDHWRRAESQHRRLELLQRERQGDIEQPSMEAEGNDDGRVLTALSSLPDRQRAALALRYMDDFSVSEVADALELNYQAAESLLARARRSFARAFEQGASS